MNLVNQFTYLGNNISTTEIEFNIDITKVWTAIKRFTAMKKFDLSV